LLVVGGHLLIIFLMKEITMAMEALVATAFISIAKMGIVSDLLSMMNSPQLVDDANLDWYALNSMSTKRRGCF